jgi:hypothetical protein
MSNVPKVPSAALVERLTVVTDGGRKLFSPFLAFAAEARHALRDFDAEVEAAGLDEEQLQEARAAARRHLRDV